MISSIFWLFFLPPSLPSPNPSENFTCSALCRITFCTTCYYAEEPQPRPPHCDAELCPYYPDISQAGNRCFKRWSICTRRSKYDEVKYNFQLVIPCEVLFNLHSLHMCSFVVESKKHQRDSGAMNTPVFNLVCNSWTVEYIINALIRVCLNVDLILAAIIMLHKNIAITPTGKGQWHDDNVYNWLWIIDEINSFRLATKPFLYLFFMAAITTVR